jgi:SAM-dependent methyltransferase
LTHEETTVDRLPFKGATDVVFNLDFHPWPFEDNSYDEIVAIHLVEHLKDLVAFMDECWRILRPGGALYLATPEAGNNLDLTHSDPTHVRCYRRHTWINYFSRSEGPKFGYTDKFWALWDLRVVDGSIHLHAMPLKKETPVE